MRLISLTLHNFKGIREFTLDTDGRDVVVYGDNATGKTTLKDAFLWLLFNKDSMGKTDFAIKTLDADGNVLHGLEHEVEAVLDLDCRQTTLRKVYAETWTKKRGSATAEFTGHETNYFADGVPVKKSEYGARIAVIADENTFKLLTSPTYFNEQLPWQKRREVLLLVCGDISDEDVIASDAQLSRLPDILRGRQMEDHRKVIAANRARINKELVALPVRVDEVTRGLPNVSEIDVKTIQAQISKDKDCLTAKQQELARIESGGEIAEKTKALRGAEAELLRLQTAHRRTCEAQAQEKQILLSRLSNEALLIKENMRNIEISTENSQQTIKRLQVQMQHLRARWHEINTEEFAFVASAVCPTCGQSLPEGSLVEAREKAFADFNLNKATKLEGVAIEGKQDAARVEELKAENIRKAKELEKGRIALEKTREEMAGIQSEVEALHVRGISDAAYTAKLTEKENLEAQLARLREGGQEQSDAICDEIFLTEVAITTAKKSLDDVSRYDVGQKRIDELKAEERRLAAEYERLEGELYLTDEFVRTKVRLLEERINSRFKHARFKLFDVQVNGGVVECCETLYGGVPYSAGLNNGARINVGLDIINVLSEHHGIQAPIFIDNAEAVVETIPTRGQMIKLVVSEADKTLRVEQESKTKKEAV